MERSEFAGLALLKIGQCKTHDELDKVARDIEIARYPAKNGSEPDISQAQYDALVKTGRRTERN